MIIGLDSLPETFKGAALASVGNDVDLLLADRDLLAHARKSPVPFYLKPLVLNKMAIHVTVAFRNVADRDGQPHPLQGQNAADAEKSLDKIVSDCLSSYKLIIPQFAPDQ